MALIISERILKKVFNKHRVSEREIRQCFRNRIGENVEDNREEHKTDPPTEWFLGRTSAGELLKILFVNRGGNLHLKSAFAPTDECIEVYRHVLGLSENFLEEKDD